MDSSNKFDPYIDNIIIKEEKLRGARKIVAMRLMESYQCKVHASIWRYIEIEKLRIFKEKIGIGSIIDHFIRAVVLSLLEKPELNCICEGDTYKIFKDVDLSYAVNTSKGLVAPIIKKINKLELNDFINKKKEIISLVQNWKHSINDIFGGTFTITNLGTYGVDLLLPIINPPQVAILGMGRICKLNISWDSETPKIRELLPISLTYDHRIVDGGTVAEFAQILQDKINEPDKFWKN